MLSYIILTIVAFGCGFVAGAMLILLLLTGATEHVRRGGR